MFCISSFIHLDRIGENPWFVNTMNQTVTMYSSQNNIVLLDCKKNNEIIDYDLWIKYQKSL